MRGYQLPPVMFNSEEAAALVTGGMLAEQMTDQSVRGPMRTALAKLTAILPAEQQHRAHRLREAMAVQSQKPAAGPVSLSHVQAATADRQVLRLKYNGATRGQGGSQPRKVAPWGWRWKILHRLQPTFNQLASRSRWARWKHPFATCS